MRYTQTETDDCVTLTPSSAPSAAVIWLHGLGADGHDFVPIVPELHLPNEMAVRFVFPHARVRPITINNGYAMRAWYDIKALALGGPEDEAGIRESENAVRALIQTQRAAGIAANRIVIAGFSQGGAIALQTALRYPQRLAGVLALSTYLPLRNTLASEMSQANRDIPMLMCHGALDPMVPLALGALSRDALRAQGYAVDWREYPMQHEVSMPEIADIAKWFATVLTQPG
jgi:phospholipase/carboxylesterase